MKILFATLLLTFMINVHALFGQLIDHPKASLTLQFEQTSGTNASSVTFNPKAGLYYTSIAGNDLYPLEVCGGTMTADHWKATAIMTEESSLFC